MKRNLLFLAMAAAVSLCASAEVTYYLAFRGTATVNGNKITGNFTNTVSKMAPFSNNGDGSYSVTIDELQTETGGFKILHDDQSFIDGVTDEFKGTESTWKASTWHTMYGAPLSGGLVSLDKDAEPTKLVNFVSLNKETGHSPGEIQFAGGVKTAKDVKLTFWPESGMLSAEGTPVDYKQLGYCCAVNKWGAPADKFLFTHEGNGIYTGTINFTDEMLAKDETYKTFKIRNVTNTKPVYGFAKDGGNEVFGRVADLTRAGEGMTQQLTGYHVDSEKRREPGIGSGSASTSVTLPATIKADLSGEYDVRFDANTGELTLTPAPGNPTAVENIAAEPDASVEYYNMQGIRVANPENGLYIVKHGNKVSKVIVK